MTRPIILVTGATGLVGRAAANAFAADNWQVLRLARQGSDINLDLSTASDLARALPVVPNVILHLAASVPSGSSGPDSRAAGTATQRIDHAIFDAARAWQCRLIYASTCGLYRRDLPETKNALAPVTDWQSPYFAAKLNGEALFRTLPRATIFRISSPIGHDLPPHLVVRRFVDLALADAALPLFGDGMREQDFIALGDLAGLFLKAARQDDAGIYNAAAGQATTMADLAATVIAVIGQGRAVLSGRPESNDCLYARYDITQTRQVFDWTPRIGLAAMIADVAGLHRKGIA